MESALRQKPIVNKLSGFRRICCENVLDKQTPCQSQPGCCSEQPSWQGLTSTGKGGTQPRCRLVASLQSEPGPAAPREQGVLEPAVGKPMSGKPQARSGCHGTITAHITNHLRSRDRHHPSPRSALESHPAWRLNEPNADSLGTGVLCCRDPQGVPAFTASPRQQPAPGTETG